MTENTNLIWSSKRMQRRLKARHRNEKLFRLFGLAATSAAGIFLTYLLLTIASLGVTGFQQARLTVDVYFDPAVIDNLEGLDAPARAEALRNVNIRRLLVENLSKELADSNSRSARREALRLLSVGARVQVTERLIAEPWLVGQKRPLRLLLANEADQYVKGQLPPAIEGQPGPLTSRQQAWLDDLLKAEKISVEFNSEFLMGGDSQEAELAGIGGAIAGTTLTLLVTLVLAFPVGVLSAIYLEEFSPKNKISRFIEVNINNLAAVPSIVFGLLGLSVFLGLFGMPRSAPLVAGLTLALMTLPTIIIVSRVSIRSVPTGIRDAAKALGASPQQVMFHHVMPLAMPGILTGTIIGLARALGETAPLLMIGMVAFVVNVPSRLTDAATVLPVQVYLWSDNTERAFVEKTAAAILVLLIILIILNGLAVILRRRFGTHQ